MTSESIWDVADGDSKDSIFFSEDVFKTYSTNPRYENLLQMHVPSHNVKKLEKKKTLPKPLKPYQVKRLLQSSKPQFPYPRFSNLTSHDKRQYLKLWRKFQHFHTEMLRMYPNQQEMTTFMELKTKVMAEQEEFNRYLEYIARHCPEDYNFINNDVNRYVDELMACYKSSLCMYPQQYSLYQTLGISTGMSFPSDSMLKRVKTLLTLGNVSYKVIPLYEKKTFVSRQYSNMVCDFPPCDVVYSIPQSSCTEWKRQPVSKDVNAKKLADKYKVDTIISMSGLETLINNHPPYYTEQWEIPVNIIQDDSDESRKTIYIDKPLAKKQMSLQQKNLLYHQISLPRLFRPKMSQKSLPLEVVVCPNEGSHHVQSTLSNEQSLVREQVTHLMKDSDVDSHKDACLLANQNEQNMVREELSSSVEQASMARTSKAYKHTVETFQCSKDASQDAIGVKTKSNPYGREQIDINLNKLDTQNIADNSGTEIDTTDTEHGLLIVTEDEELDKEVGVSNKAEDVAMETDDELVMKPKKRNNPFISQLGVTDSSVKAKQGNLMRDSQKQEKRKNFLYDGDISSDADRLLYIDDYVVVEKNMNSIKCDHEELNQSNFECLPKGKISTPIRRSARLHNLTQSSSDESLNDTDLTPAQKRNHGKKKNNEEERTDEKFLCKNMKTSRLKETTLSDETLPIRRSKRLKKSSDEDLSSNDEIGKTINDGEIQCCSEKEMSSVKQNRMEEEPIAAGEKINVQENQTEQLILGKKNYEPRFLCDELVGQRNVKKGSVIIPQGKVSKNTKQCQVTGKIKTPTSQCDTLLDGIFKLKEKLAETKDKVAPSMEQPGQHTIEHSELAGGSQITEDKTEYLHPSNGNVMYSLWNFGKVSLLIRNQVCGYIKEGGQLKALTISPKLEYQPKFGLEQISAGQLSTEWIRMYAQPNSMVVVSMHTLRKLSP
uniref:Uncharacterized protein LOC100373255 n=1 Tax=Saccoglossus kowalevskii TaxID=10224 RepID=A0ABM0M256_SACKO|nr:PREDICTED: uncharacterized protein LOC100373255 [Saccoglossus kowalevskii]